jgi:lipoate-protein ligase A
LIFNKKKKKKKKKKIKTSQTISQPKNKIFQKFFVSFKERVTSISELKKIKKRKRKGEVPHV